MTREFPASLVQICILYYIGLLLFFSFGVVMYMYGLSQIVALGHIRPNICRTTVYILAYKPNVKPQI